MNPFTFSPVGSAIAALFAKWLPMYVGQSNMDDEEAEPFQQPLCDLETAISDQPATTMQDHFLQQAVQTCFGSMCWEPTEEQRQAIIAIAMAEAKERESLQALIDEHIDSEAKFEDLLHHHQTGTPEFDEAGGDDLSSRGIELMLAIAAHPATSFEAVMLKGRYFAARQARGDLGYNEAFAFAASFSEIAGAL